MKTKKFVQNPQTKRFLKLVDSLIIRGGFKSDADFSRRVLGQNPSMLSQAKMGLRDIPDKALYSAIDFCKINEFEIFKNPLKKIDEVYKPDVMEILKENNKLLKEIKKLIEKNKP